MELVAIAAIGAAVLLVSLFKSRRQVTAIQTAASEAIAQKAPASELLYLAAQARAAGDLDTAHKLESVVAGVQ